MSHSKDASGSVGSKGASPPAPSVGKLFVLSELELDRWECSWVWVETAADEEEEEEEDEDEEEEEEDAEDVDEECFRTYCAYSSDSLKA